MLWVAMLGGDSNKHPQHMILWSKNNEKYHFINLLPTPDFPHFNYM